MRSTSFVELVDNSHRVDFTKSETLLSLISDSVGVHKMSYLAVNLPDAPARHFVLHTSFAQSWQQHYLDNDYLTIDPAVIRSFNSTMPFDWSEVVNVNPHVKKMFGESREFGVGEHGLTIPLRTRAGETAMVAITSNLSLKSWKEFKHEHLGELRMLASLLNASVMKSLRGNDVQDEQALTPREVECLRWCAEGKTNEEIGQILGIATRTVRFFIDNARRKLKCVNTVQAVAEAMLRGIL